MDNFDETMKDIKENLIARIQRQEKEIERLRKKYENAVADYDSEHYKVVKAIEHIEKHQLIYTSQYEEMSGFDNHLLEILQGSDKE